MRTNAKVAAGPAAAVVVVVDVVVVVPGEGRTVDVTLLVDVVNSVDTKVVEETAVVVVEIVRVELAWLDMSVFPIIKRHSAGRPSGCRAEGTYREHARCVGVARDCRHGCRCLQCHSGRGFGGVSEA